MKDTTDFNCFSCEKRNGCQFYCKISRLPRNLGGLGQCPKLHVIQEVQEAQEAADEKRINRDTPIKKRRTVTRTRRKTVLRKRGTTRKSNRKKVTGD